MPAGWSAPVRRWCDGLRAAGRRPGTVYLRSAHIAQLARWAGGAPAELEAGRLVEYLASREWSPETRRAVASSLRGFFAACGRVDLVEAVPAVRPVDPMPRPMPDLVLVEVLGRCRDRRLRLALRLAAEAGLRRAEVVSVHRRHLVRDLAGWSLEVQGKGGRVRVVPLSGELGSDVLEATRGTGWAFPGRDGPISPAWLGKLSGRVLPAGWTLHTLRHRFATRVHDTTGDLLAVQRLLGHSSPATTQRYVATDAARLRAAAGAARLEAA